MLTPTDIHNKDFKRAFRGYSLNEVDDFLDQVVNDYERLYRENGKLRDDLARAEKEIERMNQLEKNLQDTLLIARRTADEVMQTSNQRAADVRAAAETEQRQIVERANADAAKIRADAEIDAKNQLADAAAKVRSIVAEYDRLVREKNKFLGLIRSSLATELATLDDVMNRVPHPEEETVAPPKIAPEVADALPQVENARENDAQGETSDSEKQSANDNIDEQDDEAKEQ